MKTLYALTSEYMPLVFEEDPFKPSERAQATHRLFYAIPTTQKHIDETIAKSNENLITFEDEKIAKSVMTSVLRENNTTPTYIDGMIPFFAVPLLLTVEMSDERYADVAKKALTAATLCAYMNRRSIPAYPIFDAPLEIRRTDESLQGALKKHGIDSFEYAQINKADLSVVSAFYLAANPVREAKVSMSQAATDLEAIKATGKYSSTSAKGECRIM